LTDDSLQIADKDQQVSRAVAGKLHDAVVKFDAYRNLHRRRAVLPVIARLSCTFYVPSYKGAYHLYESVCAVEAIISKQKVILSNGYYDYKLGNLIKY